MGELEEIQAVHAAQLEQALYQLEATEAAETVVSSLTSAKAIELAAAQQVSPCSVPEAF